MIHNEANAAIDVVAINARAMENLPAVFSFLFPTRKKPPSIALNRHNCKWLDSGAGARGATPTSLAAHVLASSEETAARLLQRLLDRAENGGAA